MDLDDTVEAVYSVVVALYGSKLVVQACLTCRCGCSKHVKVSELSHPDGMTQHQILAYNLELQTNNIHNNISHALRMNPPEFPFIGFNLSQCPPP